MKWVTNTASLFTQPGGPQRACRIEPGKVVEPTCQVASATCAGSMHEPYGLAVKRAS